MARDDTSPFIRGIENRLDAIFGEDKKKPVPEEVTDPLKEASAEPEISRVHQDEGAKDSDKTPFVRGIENRLDAIFGGYDTTQPDHTQDTDPHVSKDMSKKDFKIDESARVTEEVKGDHEKESSVRIAGDESMPEQTRKSGIHDLPEHERMKERALETTLSDEAEDKTTRFEELFGELVASTSVLYSPLKDFKSTVLSIEWEVTDQIMEKFDKEVNKLSDVFAEDAIILGFLKILRFLGRYIRVKGVDAHHVAVKLLMSVYDNFEKVLLTKEMSDKQKYELLCGDVRKYRDWVETVDLAVQKIDKAEREESHVSEKAAIVSSKQRDIPKEKTIRAAKEAASPTGKMEMTPHEAFAFALDEIKKVISAEFNALRAELRLWRQDK